MAEAAIGESLALGPIEVQLVLRVRAPSGVAHDIGFGAVGQLPLFQGPMARSVRWTDQITVFPHGATAHCASGAGGVRGVPKRAVRKLTTELTHDVRRSRCESCC